MKKIVFLSAALISYFCFSNPQLFSMESDTESNDVNYRIEYNEVRITNRCFCSLLISDCNENDTSDLEPLLLNSGTTILINFTHHYSILPILASNDTPIPVSNVFTAPLLRISSRVENGIDLIEGHDQDQDRVFSQPFTQTIGSATNSSEQLSDFSDEELPTSHV